MPAAKTTDTTITVPDPVLHVAGPAVEKLNKPFVVDGVTELLSHVVAVTEEGGLQIEEIRQDESLESTPWRVQGTRTVTALDSFLAELDRRPLPNVAGTLWGNARRGEIKAVYNDHDGDVAGWRDDNLVLKLATDPDWAKWHELSGNWFSQGKFGDLLEELRHTIKSPDQADLLEIVDGIRASTSGEFESSIQRANGSQKLAYKKEVSATAKTVAGRELEVPQHIMLALKPWEGHPTFHDVPAYFRLNVTEGVLKLSVKLFPTAEILRAAWKEVTDQVTSTIGKPVYAQP